jgi:hypothetical protein
MFARRKAKVDWKSVDSTFTKQRRLHLKDRDRLDHYSVTDCEHPGFTSQRGHKHVKTKHGCCYYFDEKPNRSTISTLRSP